MKYYNWKKTIPKKELIEVCEYIKKGEIVIFPTETVYGIGANAFDEKAVQKIFTAKGRPADNPLIVHVADHLEITKITQNITKIEQKLIHEFMPGPFTLILKKNAKIPDIVSGGLDTVAVRMPKHAIAKQIIANSKVPIAAPSANISGKPSGTTIEDIQKELAPKVHAIIDGGETQIGLESTVVKVINETPYILRPGKITPEQIKKVTGKVEFANGIFTPVKENEKVESPGLKHKHYAPKTPAILLYSQDEKRLLMEVNKKIEAYQGKVVVLGFEEHKEKIKVPQNQFISLGSKNNLEQIAKNLYTLLRKADQLEAYKIIIEGVPKQGIGIAIMNRLLRTCGYNYIEF